MLTGTCGEAALGAIRTRPAVLGCSQRPAAQGGSTLGGARVKTPKMPPKLIKAAWQRPLGPPSYYLNFVASGAPGWPSFVASGPPGLVSKLCGLGGPGMQ